MFLSLGFVLAVPLEASLGFVPPDLISACLEHGISWREVGGQSKGQPQEKGAECADLNWGGGVEGGTGLPGFAGRQLLDQLS